MDSNAAVQIFMSIGIMTCAAALVPKGIRLYVNLYYDTIALVRRREALLPPKASELQMLPDEV